MTTYYKKEFHKKYWNAITVSSNRNLGTNISIQAGGTCKELRKIMSVESNNKVSKHLEGNI